MIYSHDAVTVFAQMGIIYLIIYYSAYYSHCRSYRYVHSNAPVITVFFTGEYRFTGALERSISNVSKLPNLNNNFNNTLVFTKYRIHSC